MHRNWAKLCPGALFWVWCGWEQDIYNSVCDTVCFWYCVRWWWWGSLVAFWKPLLQSYFCNNHPYHFQSHEMLLCLVLFLQYSHIGLSTLTLGGVQLFIVTWLSLTSLVPQQNLIRLNKIQWCSHFSSPLRLDDMCFVTAPVTIWNRRKPKYLDPQCMHNDL